GKGKIERLKVEGLIFWVLGLGRKEDNKRYQWLGFKTTMVNRREVVDVVASTVMGLLNDEFNESEEELFNFNVSNSDVSDSDNSERQLAIQIVLGTFGPLDYTLMTLLTRLDKFIVDPGYSLTTLQQYVKRDFLYLVSLTKCRRDKLKAVELLEGGYKAQNEKIYEYLLEEDNKIRWMFLEGLLWWLPTGLENCKLISDIFRGLVEVIPMLFPNAETRHCVRHLHANFKKVGFKINELKELLWKIARASTPRDFENTNRFGANLTCWSQDIKLEFITKWLPQLIKKLLQLTKKLSQLINKLPQLNKKLPQEKSFHSRGSQS
ncbi:hypothetical protein Goshw_000385, partial [Gossypium schwendimanii]|nr:hypothetical protein [Gossypium schwendimanii]